MTMKNTTKTAAAALLLAALALPAAPAFATEGPEGIPGLECAAGYVPGWLDENGHPTSCVRDCPSWREDGTCIDEPALPVETPEPVEQTAPDVQLPMVDPAPLEDGGQAPAEREQLAETGVAGVLVRYYCGAAIALAALGGLLALLGLRADRRRDAEHDDA